MERIFALLLAMARGVDEPADPLYLLSEEFEGAVRPWADSEQRTSFWTMLEDGSLVTVSVYNTETGLQNNSLECRTAGGEVFFGMPLTTTRRSATAAGNSSGPGCRIICLRGPSPAPKNAGSPTPGTTS